jgi:hypothetical protein
MKLAELFVDIVGKDAALQRTLGTVRGQLTSFNVALGTALGNTLSGAFGAALRGGASLGGGIAAGIGRAVVRASDLAETVNKVGVTFGPAMAIVVGKSEEMARKFGTTRQEILDAAGAFGLILTGAGTATTQAAQMSAALTAAAADASSLFNVPLPEALEKIRAGLVGEAEPLRTFGVLLSEDAVKAKAVEMGLAEVNKKTGTVTATLSESAKMAARYQLIMDGLSPAIGDLERTSGGLANQLRALHGRWTNLTTAFGASILPAATNIVRALNFAVEDLGVNLAGLAPRIAGTANQIAGLAKYVASGFESLPILWDLFQVKARQVFASIVQIGRNVFLDLAAFLADLFTQLGARLTAILRNAIADAMPAMSTGMRVGLAATGLGAFINVSDQLKAQKMAVPGVKPSFGAFGDPFRDLPDFADVTRPLYEKLDAALEAAGRRFEEEVDTASSPVAARRPLPAQLPPKPEKPERERRAETTSAAEFARKIQEGLFNQKDQVPRQQLAVQQEQLKVQKQQLSLQQAMKALPAVAM